MEGPIPIAVERRGRWYPHIPGVMPMVRSAAAGWIAGKPAARSPLPFLLVRLYITDRFLHLSGISGVGHTCHCLDRSMRKHARIHSSRFHSEELCSA